MDQGTCTGECEGAARKFQVARWGNRLVALKKPRALPLLWLRLRGRPQRRRLLLPPLLLACLVLIKDKTLLSQVRDEHGELALQRAIVNERGQQALSLAQIGADLAQ